MYRITVSFATSLGWMDPDPRSQRCPPKRLAPTTSITARTMSVPAKRVEQKYFVAPTKTGLALAIDIGETADPAVSPSLAQLSATGNPYFPLEYVLPIEYM